MAETFTPTTISTFVNDTTAVNQVNGNFTAIQTAFTDVLSRSGVTPNQMGSTLDMNSNQVINLPPPATTNSPARLIDVVSNPTITVPPTGTSGATVPLLNGNNTWSGTNTFSAATTFNAAATFNGSITFAGNNTWTGTNTFNAAVSSNTSTTMGGTVTFSPSTLFSGNITYNPTGNLFAPSAIVHRFNDLVRVGGATVSDQSFPNITKDWLSAFETNTLGLGAGAPLAYSLVSLNGTNPGNGGGALFGAQALNLTNINTSVIGTASFAVANNTTVSTAGFGGGAGVWAYYGEAHFQNSTNNVAATGMELEVRSVVANINPTPFAQANINCLTLGCGAGIASGGQPCGAAIAITNNPNTFFNGIYFKNGALFPQGSGGNGIAINMARGQSIQWSNSTPGIDGQIYGNASGIFLNGGIAYNINTPTAAYTVATFDYSLTCNQATTLTLPTPANSFGRVLMIQTQTATAVVSASANVLPITGGALSTSILAATAGKWCMMQCDGTQWRILQAN